MPASEKVHMILTKYFRGINWGHYVIYLQNMKFMQLILWSGGVYTDNTYTTTVAIRSHIMIHFMNHDYIGSLWQCQMSQKRIRLHMCCIDLSCVTIGGKHFYPLRLIEADDASPQS